MLYGYMYAQEMKFEFNAYRDLKIPSLNRDL